MDGREKETIWYRIIDETWATVSREVYKIERGTIDNVAQLFSLIKVKHPAFLMGRKPSDIRIWITPDIEANLLSIIPDTTSEQAPLSIQVFHPHGGSNQYDFERFRDAYMIIAIRSLFTCMARNIFDLFNIRGTRGNLRTMVDVIEAMKGPQANLRPSRPIVRTDATVVERLGDLYDTQRKYRILRINRFINEALHSTDIPRDISGSPQVYLPTHFDEDLHGYLDLHARAVELNIDLIIVEYI
jgi:hypothetical protein